MATSSLSLGLFRLLDRLLEQRAGRAAVSLAGSLCCLTKKKLLGHRSVTVINMIRLSVSSLNNTDSMKSCLFSSAAIHRQAGTAKTIIVVEVACVTEFKSRFLMAGT
jgi:hypothetical protein